MYMLKILATIIYLIFINSFHYFLEYVGRFIYDSSPEEEAIECNTETAAVNALNKIQDYFTLVD